MKKINVNIFAVSILVMFFSFIALLHMFFTYYSPIKVFMSSCAAYLHPITRSVLLFCMLHDIRSQIVFSLPITIPAYILAMIFIKNKKICIVINGALAFIFLFLVVNFHLSVYMVNKRLGEHLTIKEIIERYQEKSPNGT